MTEFRLVCYLLNILELSFIRSLRLLLGHIVVIFLMTSQIKEVRLEEALDRENSNFLKPIPYPVLSKSTTSIPIPIPIRI